MSAIRNYIKSLQNRPYEERVRVFWTIAVISAVCLIVIWAILSRVLPHTDRNASLSGLVGYIRERISQARENYQEMDDGRQLAGAFTVPDNFKSLTIRSATLSADGKNLRIEFTANNPTYDILVLLNDAHTNLKLIDGSKVHDPIEILTENGIIFPEKVLSRGAFRGVAIFPKPNNNNVVLSADGIYFLLRSENKFDERYEIAINGEVRGIENTRALPRE